MSSEKLESSETTRLPPKSEPTQERAGASVDSTPRPGDDQFRDNNPKAAFGAKKVGIDFLSFPVLLEQAVGMMAGGAKYGAHNYLVQGPSVMTYIAAAFRHMAGFVGGEEYDPHAGEGVKVHHLTAAQNCLHVVRAAQIAGIAFDDRPPAMPPGFIESLAPSVEAIMRNNPEPVARYLADGRRGPGRILEDVQPKPEDNGDLSRDAADFAPKRETFGIPPGFKAVRDGEGRATGALRRAEKCDCPEGLCISDGYSSDCVRPAKHSHDQASRERDARPNAHDRGSVPCKCMVPNDCGYPHCEC